MENKDCGALWVKTSQKGDKFLSGIITIDNVAHQIVVFKNGYKTKDNQPDWRIYTSQLPKPELHPNGTEKVEKTVEEEWNEQPF